MNIPCRKRRRGTGNGRVTLATAGWLCALLLGTIPARGFSSAGAATVVRFAFREPAPVAYVPVLEDAEVSPDAPPRRWLRARRADGGGADVIFGDRILLRLEAGADVGSLLAGRPLGLRAALVPGYYVLQAADAWTAAEEASALAARGNVIVSSPVRQRPIRKCGSYAPAPNDPSFGRQWYLENRDANGQRLGPDLNVRAAWSVTKGQGVLVAIADDGVEWTHPEFVQRATDAPHYNFVRESFLGLPNDDAACVSGFAVAEGNNGEGIVGVSPAARLASWKIFDAAGDPTDEQMARMFQYRLEVVGVQNHSWGKSVPQMLPLSNVEDVALSNAVATGRQGRGVILVRAAGNGRENFYSANDDGYANDPRAITVAAVRREGRAASYSNPGACVLVAAPGGETNAFDLLTTDRQSSNGFNPETGVTDVADPDYTMRVLGTSFSTPQVSGIATLLLSANPDLGYRDVQQILALSARHADPDDPDLWTNGAGLAVSHSVGFGIPDAGAAVRLAVGWSNRPAPVRRVYSSTAAQAIPDDGLRVLVAGTNVPASIVSIPSTPSSGPHPDAPTLALPLVDVGYATNDLALDLTGMAALIQRGPVGDFPDGRNLFQRKIERAAAAGAAFAIVFNHTGTEQRVRMGGTDFVPIPAVFIGQTAGLELRNQLASDPSIRAQLSLNAAVYSWEVTDRLVCGHVGVRLKTSQQQRGDLRVTLLSPHGTRSVLHRLNTDSYPGPGDWTFWSVHHLLEGSSGLWTVAISDESPAYTGSVSLVELILEGQVVTDADGDGLDDAWELAQLGTTAYGARDDVDGDGFSNGREQAAGTPPGAPPELQLDLSVWDSRLARLSWTGVPEATYDVYAGIESAEPLSLLTNVPGQFPEVEWFTPHTNAARAFFDVRQLP